MTHRARIISGGDDMNGHILPVPAPEVVDRPQGVESRQRPVDEACKGVQLRRFGARGQGRSIVSLCRHYIQLCKQSASGKVAGFQSEFGVNAWMSACGQTEVLEENKIARKALSQTTRIVSQSRTRQTTQDNPAPFVPGAT
jgi:hypothetical protein